MIRGSFLQVAALVAATMSDRPLTGPVTRLDVSPVNTPPVIPVDFFKPGVGDALPRRYRGLSHGSGKATKSEKSKRNQRKKSQRANRRKK